MTRGRTISVAVFLKNTFSELPLQKAHVPAEGSPQLGNHRSPASQTNQKILIDFLCLYLFQM
jgi:hypothetical protein